MKHIALAALLALTCPLLASAKGSAATKPAPAHTASTEAKAQAYIALHQKTHNIFRQLGVQVEEVDDKDSADAAAPQVAKLADAFAAVMAELAQLGDPTPEVEAAIVDYMTSREEEIEALAEDVVSPMMNLLLDEPACYGSEALANELSRLLGSLRDAAWSEEEEVSSCEGDDEDPSAGEAGEPLEGTDASADEWMEETVDVSGEVEE